MVKEYASPVLELVTKTTSDRNGMKKIVAAAAEAVEKIDNDVAELLVQRDNLVTVHNRYTELYKVLTDEELRTWAEVQKVTRPSSEAKPFDKAKKFILDYAEESGGYVKDSEIVGAAVREEVEMPWKNPKAVIATILLRSGRWEKEQEGLYKRKEGRRD